MKAKPIIKILLDVVMTVLYIILMFDFGTGVLFHEITGIAVAVFFIAHVILNTDMLKGLYRSIQNKKASLDKIILFILDILLPIGMLIVMITGILISRYLFTFDVYAISGLLFDIHNVTSYVCLGILGLHLLLHAKYLVKLCSALIRKRTDKTIWKTVGGFVAGCLAVGVVYTNVYSIYSIPTLVVPDTNTSSTASEQTSSESSASSQQSSSSPITSSQSSSDSGSSSTQSTLNQSTTPVKKEDEQTSEQISSSTSEVVDTPTLQEYLSKLYCTGCPKRCLLSNPRCSKSSKDIAAATAEYNATYAN